MSYEIRVTGFMEADSFSEDGATEGRARFVAKDVRFKLGVREVVIFRDSKKVFEGHRAHYADVFKIEQDDLIMRTMPNFSPTTLGRAGDSKSGG